MSNWLLDDEQKQMFSLQPQVMFILYASSYLCDIGLTDGEGLSPRAKGFKDDRTPRKNGIAEADDYSESWQQQVLKSLNP